MNVRSEAKTKHEEFYGNGIVLEFECNDLVVIGVTIYEVWVHTRAYNYYP